MASLKEIVTKAVIGKAKKRLLLIYLLLLERK